MSDSLAIKDAENHGLINSGSGVLLGLDCGYGGALPSQPPRKYGLRPTRPHTGVRGNEDNTACIEWENHVIGGRERAKHIDIRKHFAHEVIQNGKMKLIHVSTVSQLADILTKPLHFPQWQACVAGILNKKVATT